ncbi:hypothetical protein DYB34_013824, partial [Aphanomyces astaci]
MVVVPWRLHERSEDVKASAVERMRKLLMTSSYSRTQDDYEFMDRSLNVVIDLTRVHINTKREMNDILNRAKIYSCLHNPGVGVDSLSLPCSGQSVGSFEVLHGLAHAAFSVLVSSPTAILYRIDKLDFRHHILRDPVAEEMMVVNAKELYARMHPESVHRDLTINAQWNKCRDSIVAEATPRRLARAPYLRPFDHSLHPSPL